MDTPRRATAERGVSPFLLLVTALFLFLPFISVSCNASNGANVANASSSGIQAMTGADVQVQAPSGASSNVDAGIQHLGPFSRSSAVGSDLIHIDGQPLLVGAALLLVAALAFSIARTRQYRWVVAGCSGAAAACLIALQLINNSKFGSDANGASVSTNAAPPVFQLNWQAGYWLMLAGLLVVTAYNATMAMIGGGAESGRGAGISPEPQASLTGAPRTVTAVGDDAHRR